MDDFRKGSEREQHLPMTPDPSGDNPKGEHHLPTMPDPANDPNTGEQLPSEPDPSKRPVGIDDPRPPNEDGEDGNEDYIEQIA